MATVVITLTIMPESPSTNLKKLETEATKLITEFGGKVGKVEIKPIAFGLSSLNLIFIMDEAKGSTESLEKDIAGLKGISSAEVTDVRRAIG
jgi:translation elongation factor aEF-1 beta